MTNTLAYLFSAFVLTSGGARPRESQAAWRLNQRSVAAVQPTWAHGVSPKGLPLEAPHLDFFLAAHPQSIEASLRDARWRQIDVAPSDSPSEWTDLAVALGRALTPVPSAVYVHLDTSAAAQEALVLWRPSQLAGPHEALPVWQASVVSLVGVAADMGSAGQLGDVPAVEDSFLSCRDPVAEVMQVLLDGEARTLPARGPKGATLPYIELRHAAAEMRRLLSASGAQKPVQGVMASPAQLFLPIPKRPDMPLAQTVFWHDGITQKRVALTFDACSTFGHGDYNAAVIAVLEAMHVSATLFIGGHWAEMHPEELQKLAANPLFEIGNHTYSHPHMRDLSPEAQRQELLWTQEAIFSRTGILPRFFRPPYGEVDDTLITSVADAGLMTVEYDLPAGDADFHVSDARLIDWVVHKSTPGSIVVMHMNHPGNKTAVALPEIIRQLRGRGFVLSSIGEMLAEDTP